MKIKEYNDMMAYLTRPGKILGNNINKTNTERQRLAKGTKPDTKGAPKKTKILDYIDTNIAMYEPDKATKEQKKKLEKKLSKQEEYDIYFNKKSPKYYNKKFAEKPKPIKPKPIPFPQSADEFIELSDWLEILDPGGWSRPEDKRAGLLEFELADEYWQEQYQNYLNQGGTLNFQQYMNLQNSLKVRNEINKRVKDKKRQEGLTAILGLSPDRI